MKLFKYLFLMPLCLAPPCLQAQGAKALSHQEAEEVIFRVESALRKTLKLPVRKKLVLDSRPISKAEVLVEFQRIYDLTKPMFRVTPRPSRVVPEVLAEITDARARGSARLLVTNGFLAPVGPLVVNPTSGVRPEDFGRALAFFAGQVVRVTTQPDPRWTPALQGIND